MIVGSFSPKVPPGSVSGCILQSTERWEDLKGVALWEDLQGVALILYCDKKERKKERRDRKKNEKIKRKVKEEEEWVGVKRTRKEGSLVENHQPKTRYVKIVPKF